jgi:hypothetical protein
MPKAPQKPKVPTEIEFDFIKSNFFRVIRADGFFGGLTPYGGNVHVGVFSERLPYPQKIFHTASGATLGSELVEKRKVRPGIVRELEIGITMDIAQTITLRNWLNERLEQYEQLIGPLPMPTKVPDTASKTTKSNGGNKK